ncbi:glycosyltransferase family 2 protein [Clostridium tertium]
MKTEVLVSIIVPIYNVEKYLNKCVKSIVSQSYKNMEIILVDDGSQDKCKEICDELIQKDSRIKVIHKKNGGLSDARNTGIRSAKGEYILLVDSDDFIHPDMVKDLLFLALKYDADIVECGVKDVIEEEYVGWKNFTKMNEKIYNREEALAKVLDYNNCRIVAWNKLYKSKLFESIKYPVGKIHEDEFITPYLVDKCNRYINTSNQYYAYVKRENSIMTSKFSLKRMDIIEAQEKRLSYFSKKYNGKYDSIIKYHYFIACTKLKYMAQNTDQNAIEIFNNIASEKYNNLYYNILHSKDSELTKKIKAIIYKYAPNLIFK